MQLKRQVTSLQGAVRRATLKADPTQAAALAAALKAGGPGVPGSVSQISASQESLALSTVPDAGSVKNAGVEELRKMIADYQANLQAKDIQIIALEEEKQTISADFAT